jgi:hypothetical protein
MYFVAKKNPVSQRISLSEIKKNDNSRYTEIELADLIVTRPVQRLLMVELKESFQHLIN